jgi:hypothetical protein
MFQKAEAEQRADKIIKLGDLILERELIKK